MHYNDDEFHVPRLFDEIDHGSAFRTGTSDLTVWRKSADCCATPLHGGNSRKFNSQQTVFVLRKKNTNGYSLDGRKP